MAVDSTLGRANVAIRATLDKLDSDLGSARGKVDSAVRSMVSSAGQNFQTLGTVALAGIGVATAAVAGLAAAIANITIDAAPVEGIQAAFYGVAEAAGVAGDDMLAALQEGSSGMISQRDLMQSFNKAASLVSADFATQLPDAMEYLGKVSAATGEDMGFLMNSLVVGVGRVSPMILDNLGIQVSLSEATEKAAEMFGVEASELDKTQQQAGMMAVVLEKLERNTADMPDVTETATAKLARMKAEFQDTKDRIGMAFMPVLKSVLDIFATLADKFIPPLLSALEPLAEIFSSVAEEVSKFIGYVLDGQDPIDALKLLLYNLFPADTAAKISGIIDRVLEFGQKVRDFLAPIWEWITRNVELKDVLIAIGIVIASVVLPAIWGLITAVAPLILTFVAIVAAVALLRTAWENDWGGMRTKLTEFWEGTAKPALEKLWEWLQVAIPQAIETLRGFWENTLWPAMQNVWNWVQTTVFPIIQTLWDWLSTNIPAAIETLRGFWEETLLPALQIVWDFVQTSLIPLWQAIVDLFNAALTVAITALAGLWQNVLQPALKVVADFIAEKILPKFQAIVDKIQGPFRSALEKAGTFLEILKGIFDTLKSAIQRVIEKIQGLTNKIKNIELPTWLTPGSPTPFELGLLGIADALDLVNKVGLKDMYRGLAKVNATPGYLATLANNPSAIGMATSGVGGGQAIEELLRQIAGKQNMDEKRLALLLRDALMQVF